MSELRNPAAFPMAPGTCDWLAGQSTMMAGGSALAAGGAFHGLRAWSGPGWRGALEQVDEQNKRDRALRQRLLRRQADLAPPGGRSASTVNASRAGRASIE